MNQTDLLFMESLTCALRNIRAFFKKRVKIHLRIINQTLVNVIITPLSTQHYNKIIYNKIF